MKITLTELLDIVSKDEQRRHLERYVLALLAERAALKAQILELVAGDAALQTKASEAFARSEAVEAKMRAGLPAQ